MAREKGRGKLKAYIVLHGDMSANPLTVFFAENSRLEIQVRFNSLFAPLKMCVEKLVQDIKLQGILYTVVKSPERFTLKNVVPQHTTHVYVYMYNCCFCQCVHLCGAYKVFKSTCRDPYNNTADVHCRVLGNTYL